MNITETIFVELAKQVPSAVAVILVVYIFLMYNRELVKTWREFITTLNVQNTHALEKISEILQEIQQGMGAHDAEELQRHSELRGTIVKEIRSIEKGMKK